MRFYTGQTPSILFYLVLTSNGEPATGLSLSASDVQISINGGAFQSATNTPAEIGNGVYRFTPDSTEVNTAGPFAVLVDDASTETWLDFHEIIEFEYAAPATNQIFPTQLTWQEKQSISHWVWRNDLLTIESATDPSLPALTSKTPLGAISHFLNKVESSGTGPGSSITTYREDDTVAYYVRTVSQVTGNDPTELSGVVDSP